jgi:hypothetical protein
VNFPHLLESYNEQIASLRERVALDEGNPRLSWSRANAEETLASYYMANDDVRYREPLHAALLHRIDWWQRSEGMGAWDFILYTCVSLALEDRESLKQLLIMPVKTEGYVRVTVEWYLLQRAILLKQAHSPKQCKKTQGEERLFKALTDMSNRIEPDWSDVEGYWKATRNRLHSLTILQHRNFLKDGMMAFWRSCQDAEPDAAADGGA